MAFILDNADPDALARQLYDDPMHGSEPILSDGAAKVLTEEEKSSATWIKINRFLVKRLEDLREINDNPLEPLETAAIRGKIDFIKEFLATGLSVAIEDPDSPDLGY